MLRTACAHCGSTHADSVAVAVGLQASRYDLSEDEARAWLADAGYRVVLAVG